MHEPTDMPTGARAAPRGEETKQIMTRPARTIDLATMLEGRKLTPFNYLLICLSWLVTMFDGLDMMLVSFTAPYMQDELHLTDVQLSGAFSAGTAGMIIGGLIFTYVGDRIGRRPTIIMCTLAFGVFTFLTGFATIYPALLALRFLDGLAIGGALPLAWALNVEFIPSKLRATVVAFIMMGFSIGSSLAAPLTNSIAPIHGWEGVYFAGGIGSVACAILIAIFLPESPRFLISKGKSPARILATLKRLDGDLDVQPDDHFILAVSRSRTCSRAGSGYSRRSSGSAILPVRSAFSSSRPLARPSWSAWTSRGRSPRMSPRSAACSAPYRVSSSCAFRLDWV